MQVIQENSKRFLQEMNATVVALTLSVLDLIPERVKHDIDHSKCSEDANGHLLTYLKKYATEEQVLEVLKVVSEKIEYRKMSEFAANLLHKLEQGTHHSSAVTAYDY